MFLINTTGETVNLRMTGIPTGIAIPQGKSWFCICNDEAEELLAQPGICMWPLLANVCIYRMDTKSSKSEQFALCMGDFRVPPEPRRIESIGTMHKLSVTISFRSGNGPRFNWNTVTTCGCDDEVFTSI